MEYLLENSLDGTSPAWDYSYLSLAIAFVILFILDIIYSWNDFCSINLQLSTKSSYFFFALALISRIVGYGCNSYLSYKTNQKYFDFDDAFNCSINTTNQNQTKAVNEFLKYNMLSTLSSAIPGYMISLAYSIIFFSWCSVFIESMEKKASTFIKKYQFFSIITVCVVMAGFLASFIAIVIFMARIYNHDTFKHKLWQFNVGHVVEATCAIVRDLFLTISFVIYLHRMWAVLTDPCGPIRNCFCCKKTDRSGFVEVDDYIGFTNSPTQDNGSTPPTRARSNSLSSSNKLPFSLSYETALVLMCLAIIIGLSMRTISILIYTIIWAIPKSDLTGKDYVCNYPKSYQMSSSYLVIFIIEQIFSEILPVGAIIGYRAFLKHGQLGQEVDVSGFQQID